MRREKSDEGVQNVTVRLPIQLWRRWQIQCLTDGEPSASAALARLIGAALPQYTVTAIAPGADEGKHHGA